MRLVIFDCDGTLVDSQHMIVEAMKAAFSASGLPLPDRAAVLQTVGLSINDAMEMLTGLKGSETVVKLAADYRLSFAALRHEARMVDPLFSGAREALAALAEEDDILLGIATGKSRRGVAALLEREGLEGLFVTIQTADDAPSKPHPAMILQAMEAVGASPAETVMIGDTSFDMLMARAASVSAIGVGWGYHEPSELLEAGASTIAQDFPSLMAALLPGRGVVAA